jgi:NOL1/NOP2/fmu family ribosome biogenesis protein
LPIGNGYGYGFYPNKTKGEGFFITIVRKLSETKPGKLKLQSQSRTKSRHYNVPENIVAIDDLIIDDQNGTLFAVSGHLRPLMDVIKMNLRVVHSGLPLGVLMKNELIPDHALAMSVHRGNYFPVVELTMNQALLYLKGETSLNINLERGWHIVSYQGQALGFIKSLGSRINNYYPKGWRIRMQIQDGISE